MVSEERVRAVERLLIERLGGVVSDPAALIRRALAIARLDAVPTDPVGVELFCRGALDEAASEVIGTDAASEMMDELVALASSMPTRTPVEAPAPSVSESTSRPRKRKEASGTRRRREVVVLVASRDEARTTALVEALGPIESQVAPDVFSLVQAAEASLDREIALVVDGTVPGLRGPILMTLARILPPSAQVVFWGAPPPNGSVELPAKTFPTDATAQEIADHCAGASGEDAGDAPPPARVILLADDDPLWRSALERRLRHAGYVVVSVSDGFAALEAAIDHRPALVLTDFDMPTLDGQQLAQLLVGRFGDDAPPVIMISSRELGPVASVRRVLAKSVPFEELLAEIHALLPPVDPGVPLARPG